MNTKNDSISKSALIAEDDDDLAFLVKHVLEREGFKVIYASDGRQAARCIDSMLPPEIIILDLMMPYRNGFQLVEKIRSKRDWKNVPVIILTSKTQERDVVRALDAGANDYMTKPFNPAELIARVRRYMEK
ncbi:MAG: response regulator transcription factor [Deltaproteobacteria bacterium]|nr:response regulator transcription factor [Deltaproteobacteria bacterium]